MNRATFRLLLKHQLASVITTAVDFGTMIGLVELAHANPVWATPVGATAGAVTNFLLGRRLVFAGGGGNLAGAGVRYALVSLCSLGLNTAGEHLLFAVLGVQYLLARALVAIAVSLLWNFPMQRYFVFPQRRRGEPT